MGKVLKVALFAAAAFTAGVSLIGFGTLSGVTAFGIAATDIVLVGLAAGASLFLSPSFNVGEQGQQIGMASGPAEPREYVYGERRTGGSVIYRDTRGPDNEDLWIASVVASHEIESFQEFRVDEKIVTLSSTAVQESPYNGFMNIHTELGTDTQAANGTMVSELANWTTNHQGKGNAYFAVKLKFDQDIYPGGIPKISAVIRGKKVLDTRTSTTAYSVNPVLCCLDYLMDSLIGPGFPLSAFDTANINAAANICDQPVTVVGGGSINRYEAHGVINSDMAHAEVIQLFEESMAGTITESGGKFRFHPGEWDPSTLSLDEDDTISISVTPAPTRNNLVNAVKGLFIDPAQAYQPQDYPSKTDIAAESEDGGERFWLDLGLGFTTDHRMAQRIAKIAFERNRRRMTARIKTNLTGLGVKVMDVIDVTHGNWNWNAKTFRVREWSFDPNSATVDMVLSEEDAAVYSWASGTDEQTYGPPATPTFFSPFGVDLGVLGGFGFGSLPFTGSNGITVPGLQAFWSTPGSWAQKIQVQYKGAAEAATLYKSIPEQALIGPDKNHFPVVPGDYDLRGRYLTTFGTWSPWASQLGTNIPAGAGDATAGAQLGVNVLDQAGTLTLLDRHALNSLVTGQNLWIDNATEYSYGGPGFQGFNKIIQSNGSPGAGQPKGGFVAGELVVMSAELKADSSAVGAGNASSLTLQMRDGSDVMTRQININGIGDPADTWVRHEQQTTMPSSFEDIHWGIGRTGAGSTGTIFVRNFQFEKAGVASAYSTLGKLVGYDQADTAQLVDDAITQAKITANAVGAGEIIAGAVGNSEIAANAVDKGEIITNATSLISFAEKTVPQTMTLNTSWQDVSALSFTNLVTEGSPAELMIAVALSMTMSSRDPDTFQVDVRVVRGATQVVIYPAFSGKPAVDITDSAEPEPWYAPAAPVMNAASPGTTETWKVQARLQNPKGGTINNPDNWIIENGSFVITELMKG